MIRGTKPKPTKLKILQGNPGKRPLNEHEPIPFQVMPEYPKFLDSKAKKEWKRVAPLLYKLGLLTELDGTILAGYCQLYSRWEQIKGEQKESKLLMLKHTVDGAGNEHVEAKQNPLVIMARQTLKEIRMFCAEFGMTPSSRARMVVGGEPTDPMDDYLGRKKK